MNQEHQIIYSDKEYSVLAMEQEYIVHPAAFGLVPLAKSSLQCSFSLILHIDDYHLFLDRIVLHNCDDSDKHYEFEKCMVSYNGAILIGANPVNEYYLKDSQPACFSYQNVKEFVFADGVLITTVDQNKAMLRIRKNIELGLRNLTKKRDLRCIKKFMNTAFIGDYKPIKISRSRMKYLRDMKKDYEKENIIINS